MKHIKTFENKYISTEIRYKDFCVAISNNYLFLAKVMRVYNDNSMCSLQVIDFISDGNDNRKFISSHDGDRKFKYNIELSVDSIIYFSSSSYNAQYKFEKEKEREPWFMMKNANKYNL